MELSLLSHLFPLTRARAHLDPGALKQLKIQNFESHLQRLISWGWSPGICMLNEPRGGFHSWALWATRLLESRWEKGWRVRQ